MFHVKHLSPLTEQLCLYLKRGKHFKGVEVNMSVRVMLVDRFNIVREGIGKILESDNLEITAEAVDGAECLAKLDKVRPQIIIIDTDLPDEDGIIIINQIKKKNSYIKIIVLTCNYSANIIARSMEAGAKGFLTKECESVELKKAIYKVMSDENYVQHSLLMKISKNSTTRIADKNKIDLLTNREMEVLIQIANGMFNKEIATMLNISERTVKNHVSSIFKKIGVSDRTQAAVFAIKNNIVSL